MRYLSFSSVLVLLVVLVAACGDELAPTAALSESDAEATFAAKGGQSGPSANGHTNFAIEEGLQTFSFHAREKQDGAVEGSFQVKSRGQNTTVHGHIDCLTVVDNQAFLNGVVNQINEDSPLIDFLPVGSRVYFGVEDNGEGSEAIDAWTDLFPVGGFAGCPDLGFELIANEGGNIQVKP